MVVLYRVTNEVVLLPEGMTALTAELPLRPDAPARETDALLGEIVSILQALKAWSINRKASTNQKK